MSVTPLRADGMMSVLNRVANERARFGGQGGPDYVPDVVYATDGIAATIVDRPAEDAISAGFTIVGDENNDILNEFDRLDAWPAFVDALRWMRLHGGGAILMFVEDGLDLTEPLDIDRIRRLDDLLTYPANSIMVGPGRYNDPARKNYGWPSNYEIRPEHGNPFPVHETRLIFFPGDPLPPAARARMSLPWVGRSVLDACFADLLRYRAGLRLSEAILSRKQQLIHKLSSLGQMLSQGEDEIVAKRLSMADSVRGVFNMLAVDAEDDMILADSDLSNIDGLLKDYKIALCASSRMTMPVLFGEQVAGLNANSEGMQSVYDAAVNKDRTRVLKPAIEKLAGVIWAQQGMRREPERWQVKFNPLWTPSDKEMADIALAKANVRKVTMDAIDLAVTGQLFTTDEGRQAATTLAFPELELLNESLPTDMPDDVEGTGPVVQTQGGDDGI